MSSRTELRERCRAARAALAASVRADASRMIARHIAESASYRAARRVAIYWPISDEVDLRGLLAGPLAAGREFYLPRMLPARAMEFLPLGEPAELQPNDWGIPEPMPEHGGPLDAQALDLVCVPLLGFDRAGNRLGQGGGFYDRAFEFVRERHPATPVLVGVAFACQELPALEAAAWDVPLAAVATEHGLIACGDAQRRNAR